MIVDFSYLSSVSAFAHYSLQLNPPSRVTPTLSLFGSYAVNLLQDLLSSAGRSMNNDAVLVLK